jgi:hypothetical protein
VRPKSSSLRSGRERVYFLCDHEHSSSSSSSSPSESMSSDDSRAVAVSVGTTHKRKREDDDNNGPLLARWNTLKEAARSRLERTVIWDPTRDLYRYDLELNGPDGRAWTPTVIRTSAPDTRLPFVFRGFNENSSPNGQPVLKQHRRILDRDDVDEWRARSRLLRCVTDRQGSADECVSSPDDLVIELRDKLCVKCEYWTTFAVGAQICTTAYRSAIDTHVLRPLVRPSVGTGLIPPLAHLVLDYLPFFLQCVYANFFCDEDELEENPDLARYCHDCSGEDPERSWYLSNCDCTKRQPRPDDDLSIVATPEQRQTAVALWTAIHRACADVPDLEELTHVN